MSRATCVVVLIALSLVTVSVGALAYSGGIGAAAFLRRGVDARALGMAGAHVAVADGYSAMYWNPAGLARVASPQLGGMTTDLYGAEIYLNFLSALYPWQLSYGEVPEEAFDPQTPSEILQGPASLRISIGGSFTEMATEVRAYDDRGNPLGLIRYSEGLYGLGAGAWVPGLGYAGAVVKAYSFRAPRAGVGGVDATAFGVGFDVGLAAPVWRGLWLGLSGSDIGNSRIKWRNTPLEPTDRVAGRYTAGGAYVAPDLFMEGDRLITALDVVWEPLVDTHAVKAGVEYSVLFLSLRGGIALRPDVPLSFSAGVGVHVMQLSIDAAWTQNREIEAEGAGHTLVASASFRF